MTDRDEKGDDMAKRMEGRFGPSESKEASESGKTAKTGETSETAQESKQSQTSKTSMNTQTTNSDKAGEESKSEKITDRKSVLMYLPDDQHDQLDYRFDELNLQHKREHGEALEKNRDYYPAVIEAALNEEKSLEAILLGDGE